MSAFLESLRLAVRAIRSYRLRAFLTMLGITIGVFAITLTLLLVDSMEYSVTRNLNKLGNTTLFVHKWPWKDNSEDWYKYYKRPDMKFADYLAIRNRLKGAEAVAFVASKRGETLKAQDRELTNSTVVGATYDYAKANDLRFGEGRYFTQLEADGARKVAVIGYSVARALFGTLNATGRQLNLRGRRLTVVGVLAQEGSSLFGDSRDEKIYFPYRTMATLYNPDKLQENTVIVRAANYAAVPRVEDDLVGIMRNARGLRPGVENNFSINKQESLLETIGSFFAVLEIGGVVISLFALLVGGFGIANIMFVAVKERTKEIGMQKALGATRRFILSQFLIEAVVLCLLGAVMGLLLLGGIAWVGQRALDAADTGLTVVVELRSLAIGTTLAAFTGLLAGILPALSAARLSPVAAIRQGG